ncbi:MAG: NADH-flavin oxidoreductase/NADH oxidase [Sphingomonadales bacterium]|nr:NADH-flavin oxidoreductase/NADH oxidase [Sphingomonadales bacterium]MBU3991180.1 FAD-dependent oxidoreductase [Alphaproteobacteria bacterium]
MALDKIFTPLQIGPVEVPNRVCRTAHGTGLAKPHITDAFIAFHAARAKGGCGLTILEAASVHPSSCLEMALHVDDLVDGYKALTAATRPYGMKVFQQLWHGGNLYPSAVGGPPWAVSTVAGFGGVVGEPMREDQIRELIDAFVQSAIKARDGGLDGVEIHAGHGYLFHQFLSRYYNTRTDRWGGDLDGRMLFLMETARAVRAAVGGQIAIGVRLSSSEAPGGVSEADNRYVLEALQRENLIDYINVSKGDYFRMDTMVGTMHNAVGYELSSAKQVMEIATVPRIVAGRFRTLEEAEQSLRDGDADLISMVRAHIADPELVNKSRAGKIDQVRPCVACNQGCIGGSVREGMIGCLVNPAAARELALSEDMLEAATAPAKVLVVGGGPGGMEAARVFALQGHKVVLAEASPGLGGAIAIARRAPKLHTLGDIAYWLEQEVYRLGVDVRLSTYMDADDVRAEGADLVVIATGSQPRLDGFQLDDPGEPTRGTDLPHVHSSTDALSGDLKNFGKSALVYDSVGHYESIAVCEHLMAQGLSVTLLTPHPAMTAYVNNTFRTEPALERLYRLGDFEALTRHRLIEIRKDSAIVRPAQAGSNKNRNVAADTVILVSQNEPSRSLYDELRDEMECYLIGDARSPRDVQAAIGEGHRAARKMLV